MIAAGVLCVDRVVPTVSITSPAAGGVSGTITIAASAADNDQIASVQFKIDGANLGSPVTSAPYQVSYNTTGLVNGGHTIQAVATDREGNSSTTSVGITIGNVPVVSMTAPANGSNVAGVITLSANVTGYGSGISVQFYRDGSPVGSALTSGPYQMNYDTRADVNGTHTFSVTATDAQSNSSSASVSVTYHNNPVATITSPAAGNVVGVITVSASVTQYGSGCTVQFRQQGSNIGSAQSGGSGNYSMSYDTHSMVNGNHTIDVVVTDIQGNQTVSAGVVVTVKNTPTVTWTSPGGGTLAGTQTFSANVTGYGTGITVQFQVDGTNIGPSFTSGPYSFSYDTHGVANGNHTFRVIATDAQGNQTIVSQVNNVQNVPAINFYAPGNGATINGNVQLGSYVTQYGASVTVWFYIDGGYIGGSSGGTGYYASNVYDTHYLGVGWHTITCIAQDNSGNQTRVDYSAYVNNAVPGAQWIYLGNLMSWYDGDDQGSGPGWYSMRDNPSDYDGRWNSLCHNSISWWDQRGQGAGAVPAIGLPNNPDPTHYQMRMQFYCGWFEYGSDHNHVYGWGWVNGYGEVQWADNHGGWGDTIYNVNNGDYCYVMRWASDWGWNNCYMQDMRIYVDFVIRGGYGS